MFRPASGCGTGCLDPAGARSPFRAAALLVALLAAALGNLVVGWLPARAARRAAPVLLRAAVRATLGALRVTPTVDGRLPAGPALLVANHVSWLDIVALLAAAPAGRLRIVAKSEVAGWPVIGRLARLSGTIFIDRERPKTLRDTVREVHDALAAGDTVAVFAEGTTTCGRHGVPYRPALFQAAVDADARIVPIALGYADRAGTPTTAPAFVGDESLVASIGRVLGAPGLRVTLAVGVPLHPQSGASRRSLARMTRLATPVIGAAPIPARTATPARVLGRAA